MCKKVIYRYYYNITNSLPKTYLDAEINYIFYIFPLGNDLLPKNIYLSEGNSYTLYIFQQGDDGGSVL